MEIDLWTNKITKKEQVFLFIKEKGFAKTSDVIRFGLQIFSNRAARDMFQLAADGRIEHLTKEEKVFRRFNGKEHVWRVKP